MPMPPACTRRLEAGRTGRERSGDILNPARGIMLGCAIGAGLWVGLVALVVA